MMRPKTMAQFVGQSETKPLLSLELATGNCRNVAIFGPAGLGKTSLAGVIANTLNREFHEHIASETWTPEWVTDMLLDLSIEGYDDKGIPGPGAKKHVVYIDEFHSCRPSVMDAFLRPIEDSHVWKNGLPNWLSETTYIISTNYPEKVPNALLQRFPLQFNLVQYTDEDMTKIVRANFPSMPKAIAEDIARRSKGIPRLAISFGDSISLYKGDADTFFKLRGIDEHGLDSRDRKYLEILEESDRPLSLNTIASCMRDSASVISTMVEPTLIFKGLVHITGKGRTLAAKQARGKRG